MRTLSLTFALLVSCGLAVQPDFQAPGGGPIEIQTTPGDRVTVTSAYWRFGFDLRNGGALDSIVFTHGSGKNLLVTPFRTYVDNWSDRNAPNAELRSSREGDVVTLKFSGRMAAAGRVPGPVGFETTWTLSPFVIRADHRLRFSEDVQVSTVGIGSVALRPEISEWGLRPGPADDPDARKQIPATFGTVRGVGGAFIAEHHAPLYLLFFERGVEGLDFTVASDLATWEDGLSGRAGLGRYEALPSADRIGITREPLHSPRPVEVRKGEYTFSYYIGLPRIVEKANRKWRHLSFGNQPFPSDAEIARWAENGVNIVRLHNDSMPDGNFWHDGAWPPYDEKGMAEVRRVVAACHRNGILVVPYFSIHEFHPVAEGYKEHETEWKRSNDELGTVYHNNWGTGEFGAQMCPQSGWLERRKKDIERAYRELGFDGIYYDWVMSLPCNNKAHNARLHTGTDGVIGLLAWTRRLIAPKNGTLIVHLYGKMPSIAFENFGDLVVNMEEISDSAEIMRMGEAPLPTVLAESLPRSPCPSYREDRPLERNRNNIAQLVVLGMFPWAGEPSDPVLEETLKLFRAFKPYRLEEMRLRDAFSGAVRTAWPDVYGALYTGQEFALAVLSNTSNAARKNVVWTVKPDLLGFGTARLTVRDPASGQTRQVDAPALEDGSLTTTLGPYEYRVFEVRPAR